jgi:acyl-CoA synthetase (AMP-forming)/AMP-acid ligase II
VAHISNVSFDAATFEIWGALLNGARLEGFTRAEVLDLPSFTDALRARQISAMFVTTALFNQIVAQRADAFATLRAVLFGGEACDPQAVRAVLEAGPPTRLLHVYGPTEGTTFSTWQPVTHVPAGAQSVPIGRPIANTTAYVLDAHLRPVPIGVPGELYVGGDGLAHGYHRRPDLTAERFVPNPFVDCSSQIADCRLEPDDTPSAKRQAPSANPTRLYRTGDLARWLPDGRLLFLGRIDQQVKIRGFRVELDEIAVVLRQHPFVREAVVLAREDAPGDKRLVAYLVPAADAPGEALPAELRAHLQQHLPAYMLPSAFVPLERLPLTPNGKIDKRALPAPPRSQTTGADEPAERPPILALLAQLWAEVLNLDDVGVNDNFFAIGGHSLLATQLITHVRAVFRVDISIRELFAHPTVTEFAEALVACEPHPGQIARIAQFLEQMRQSADVAA